MRAVITVAVVLAAPDGAKEAWVTAGQRGLRSLWEAVLVPNQPKTPAITYRIPVELRELAQARANADGVTESDVVRAALEAYLK